jgi:hypothetical protein
MNHREFLDALARGPYAWPGGYPLLFDTTEGPVSFAAAWRERAYIVRAIADGYGPCPLAIGVNWESDDLACDLSGDTIEAAYVEQGPEGLARFDAQEWSAYTAWCQRYQARRG